MYFCMYITLMGEVSVFPVDFDVEEKMHFDEIFVREKAGGPPSPPSKGF